jgi:hypothetical protein
MVARLAVFVWNIQICYGFFGTFVTARDVSRF